mgnify:CR=1 FL=1
MQSAKLSKEVMPENYNLLIEPSHDNLTFKGKVEINLLIDTPTNNITLHSSDLKISKASLKSNPKDSPKIELSQKEETLKLTFKNKISHADTLIIEFSGTISDKLKGFYKAKYFIDKKEKTFLNFGDTFSWEFPNETAQSHFLSCHATRKLSPYKGQKLPRKHSIG